MVEGGSILQRLETARKRLIDVSRRNRFLSYRPKRASLKIKNPPPQLIFDIVVDQGKGVRFMEQPEPQLFRVENTDTHTFKSSSAEATFITDENKQNMDRKLLQIWRDATSIQEEQGVNLLFIALGALFWYEDDSTQEPRCAPLVFIPVVIEREQGNKFLVRFEGTEVMGNLSLSEMLRQQFNITLSPFESANEEKEKGTLQQYFERVQKTVREQSRWYIDDSFAVMALFNFTKYIMYQDLSPDNWGTERSPSDHKVIQILLGEEDPDCSGLLVDDSTDIDANRPVEQAIEVYDADSSQITAMMQAKQATLMIIEGPPGTGKSQTITNLIAEAIYEGQRVLFVSEKRAALDVVWQRLQEAGIASACLELHSGKARKKNFYEQLNNTLREIPQSDEQKRQELEQLARLREKLNSYCRALHTPVPGRGVTPYRCISQICRLGKEQRPFIGSFRVMKDWDAQDFQRKWEIVQQLQNFVKHNGVPSQSPLWGCGLKSVLPEDYEQVREQASEAIVCIQKALDYAKGLAPLNPHQIRERIRLTQPHWERSIEHMEQALQRYHGKWTRYFAPQYWWWSRYLTRLWGGSVQDDSMLQVIQTAKAIMEADRCLDRVLHTVQVMDALANLRNEPYEEQKKWLSQLVNTDLDTFQTIAYFNRLREEAQKENLHEYAEWAAKHEAAATELLNTLERTWFKGILSEAFEQHPILRDFADEYEDIIQQFRDLDRMLLKINRLRVATKHLERLPRHRGVGNLGKLQRELQKSRAHKPIRQIMAEAGEAVLAIKPVFMMSPLSVAMYLPRDGPQFDIVIFDEASQVKPEDAFGAILRAKRAIIVGDSKQLPPTTFFDRITEDNDDQEDVTTGLESILDLAGSAIPEGHPLRKRLRWHYRSKHHTLIACSNRLFYGDSLIVAPNPETKPKQLGITFRYVPDATYDRGGSRRNMKEAQVVAQAVIEHVKDVPDASLGVAAFSIAQQEAIQDEIERLRQTNPEYDRMLSEFDKHHEHEPLFVKNLETVQGDERDVILISVGYGKDENGYLSMNFGPLNKEGGEKRLNVLITRARMRCVVFSSIRSSDIRIEDSSSAGVNALRTFLHYAETGEMDIPSPTQNEPMSPFEEAVINFLKEQGYQVVPQVGSSGFYVDIGIVDPNDASRFVLGVECDGAQYHSSRTARDRDRLRQQILEQRGWRIHRIWSTSWYRNPEAEKRRLLQAVQTAIDLASQPPNESTHKREKPTDPSPHVAVSNSPGSIRPAAGEAAEVLCLPPYQFASPREPFTIESLTDIIVQVVKVESPVHIEELIRRVREALGYGRAGGRIREGILDHLQIAARSGEVEIDGDFIWIVPRNPIMARSRAKHPPQYKKLEYIHPREIQEAILFAVRHSFGLRMNEVCSEVARLLLGVERVTEKTRVVILQQVKALVDENKADMRGETLVVRQA